MSVCFICRNARLSTRGASNYNFYIQRVITNKPLLQQGLSLFYITPIQFLLSCYSTSRSTSDMPSDIRSFFGGRGGQASSQESVSQAHPDPHSPLSMYDKNYVPPHKQQGFTGIRPRSIRQYSNLSPFLDPSHWLDILVLPLMPSCSPKSSLKIRSRRVEVCNSPLISSVWDSDSNQGNGKL